MKANKSEADDTPTPEPGHTRLRIDAAEPDAHYCNLTRVTAGPEEVIVDLGMTVPNAANPQELTGRFTERVILNYYNAKRLTLALQATVARFEQRFGSLELDPSKRIEPEDKKN